MADTSDTSTTSMEDTTCLVNDPKSSIVHLLPCNIHHDGPAPVKNYFQTKHVTKKQNTNKEYLVSNFRGRRLEGLNVPLPPSTVGCIVHTNRTDKNLEVHSTFNSLTVWEHDHVPSEEVMNNSLDYFEIANIVSIKYIRCNFQ